ncbi:ABSCISIC ACID-INSENSITIVE 5-like protein 2 [Dendrobium catenatum]|uniref:ABSCISIC ACID-INSENSITIVE 5-like protein 2 n=1 Tax=Dendrobium catenatum TaxID=906689 RepID=A0A2I0WK88_9ASPA|nr:ABSCISIC ACID-INSENSITIVE 5-like protein 2 [Dendrobium catenatum]
MNLENLLENVFPHQEVNQSALEDLEISRFVSKNTVDEESNGPKRVAGEEMAEKALERRKKRMIKNRESAARSRIRKQAYTSELENIILRLEEENERLKKEKVMRPIVLNKIY